MTRSVRTWVSAALLVASAAVSASGQYLMIPDSSADRIMLFSAQDGSLVNQNFIVDAGGSPYDFNTPKDAIQVGNEIWVSDQISDAIFRFTASLTPTYIATISGGMDNLRGMGQLGSRVYVSNAGTANGAPGAAVIVYNTSGVFQFSFPYPDPFDCTELNGRILVCDGTGDDITSFAPDGTGPVVFHPSTGVGDVNFPEQITVANTGPSGAKEVWVAGFTSPSGVYRYDVNGALVAYYAVTGGMRGVAVLGNGNVLCTEGATVKYFTPPSITATVVVTGGMTTQYINPLNLGPTACSIADIATEGNPDVQAGPDGAITGVDADAFIQCYNNLTQRPNGSYIADVIGDLGVGPPNGQIEGYDSDAFFIAFYIGC